MNLKPRALALALAVGAAVGAIVNSLSVRNGGPELSLPALIWVAALLIGGAVLYLASQVSKFSKRETRSQAGNMNSLLAARVAVFAQSLALTGALVMGWQLAILVFQLGLMSSRASTWPLAESAISMVAGLFMMLSGVIAVNMCRIPPGDDEDGGGTGLGEGLPQTGPLANRESK